MVLVTGVAGFIGFHTAKKLLDRGDRVVGVDNVNSYYDPELKEARLRVLAPYPGFSFERLDISDPNEINTLFQNHSFQGVVHLAAQAGVRYSLINPHAYTNSNVTGFLNILEACRHATVKHLVFASTSSVYGGNTKMPFSVGDNVDHPISLYAATKKANELMAHCYAHLYRIPCTGLRFFTVYGPWGRPDMALFIFTDAILRNKPIDVFNFGNMQRDFTYIDDIVESVVRVLDSPAKPDPQWDGSHPRPQTSSAPFRLYNIGNHHPIELMKVIDLLENALGRKAEKKMLPMQPGDVPATYADVSDLSEDFAFHPATPIETGIVRFVEWYRHYYKL